MKDLIIQSSGVGDKPDLVFCRTEEFRVILFDSDTKKSKILFMGEEFSQKEFLRKMGGKPTWIKEHGGRQI